MSVSEARHDAAKEFHLGVLLVHGIGTQRPSETLVRWGDALLDVIRRATAGHAVLTVEQANPGDESGDTPAEMKVRIRAGGHEERWLITEGWWADSFPAPSYAELVSWSLRAVPWFIAIHYAGRYWRVEALNWDRGKLVAILGILIQLPIALLLAPVFLVLLAFVLLLGLIPISQLRMFSLSIQSALTATVGDSLAFVESPVRAALIRTRILERFQQLHGRSKRTIIVAHSQGAAAALDALEGFVDPAHEEPAAPEQTAPATRPVPNALVTFGAGINQIASLKALSAGLPKERRNSVWFAAGALAVGVIVAIRLYFEAGAVQVLQALALWIGSVAAAGLVGWASIAIVDRLTKRWPAVKEHRENIVVTTLTVWLLMWIAFALFLSDRMTIPFGAVNFLVLSLMISVGVIASLLSNEMRASVTTVRKPKNLDRWIDFYASDDPVPNGPTRITGDAKVESVPIWNRGSIISDHTTYWENLDGFVLRVATVCAETAQSPWTQALPLPNEEMDRRAAWRIPFLSWANRLHALTWFAAFVLVWTTYGDRLPLPFDPPRWLPMLASRAAQFVVLVTLFSLSASVTAALLRWPWRIWVHQEQRNVLSHTIPTGWSWIPVVCMSMVLGAVGLGLDAAARQDKSMIAQELAPSFGRWREFASDLADIPILLFGFAIMMTGVARLLWPAPSTKD